MGYKLFDVLVLISPNDDGKIALQQAMVFQKILSYRLVILHVLPPVSFLQKQFNTKQVNDQEIQVEKKLTRFVKDYFDGSVPEFVLIKVVRGRILPVLLGMVRTDDYFFIILKRGATWKRTANALEQHEIDKIIGNAHCPVLTINDQATNDDIKTILVPIDISESTKKRLLWASMFAKNMRARIQIVSALNVNIDETKSLAFRNGEKIKTMLEKRGLDCEVEILRVHGRVKHDAVLSYMINKKPDFVIIRTRQVPASFKSSIGPFAKRIIHGSSIPVFTVSQTQSDIAEVLL